MVSEGAVVGLKRVWSWVEREMNGVMDVTVVS